MYLPAQFNNRNTILRSKKDTYSSFNDSAKTVSFVKSYHNEKYKLSFLTFIPLSATSITRKLYYAQQGSANSLYQRGNPKVQYHCNFCSQKDYEAVVFPMMVLIIWHQIPPPRSYVPRSNSGFVLLESDALSNEKSCVPL